MKKFKALILGAGYRGRAYAQYAQLHPDQWPELPEAFPA